MQLHFRLTATVRRNHSRQQAVEVINGQERERTMAKVEATAELIGLHAASIPNDLKSEFCKLWPDVKKGLQILESILKLIPPLAFAATIVGTIVSLGDAVQKAVCK